MGLSAGGNVRACSPGAVGEIIRDLLADFTIGRDPSDPSAIFDDLYDLMRVRGYNGGFYVDALAAIDIALWDIAGRQAGKPVVELLGGEQSKKYPPTYPACRNKTVGLVQSWPSNGRSEASMHSNLPALWPMMAPLRKLKVCARR